MGALLIIIMIFLAVHGDYTLLYFVGALCGLALISRFFSGRNAGKKSVGSAVSDAADTRDRHPGTFRTAARIYHPHYISEGDYECGSCGARFDHEEDVCPVCGVRFERVEEDKLEFDEELEEELEMDEMEEEGW